MPPLDIGVFGMRGIPSTYSGFETFFTALLPELAARGHDVTAYCRSGLAEDRWEGDHEGVHRRSLPSITTKQLDTLSHGLVASVAARVRRHDVLLVCNVANVPFCAVARATGQRIVLTTDGQEWLRGKWGRVARGMFLSFARRAQWSATALISDCNAMRSVYLDEFHADSTVIPYCWNGIDAGPEPPTGEGERRSYFLTGGRLVPENNIDAIARAFSRTDVPFPLIVLGAANYRSPVQDALEELAARDPRIDLRGHVGDRAEFGALLSNARAYFHGHSVGGMNPSLVEAMGAGALIAAYGTAFNRETLGPDAFYFDDCDADLERLVVTLADLSEDEDRRRRADHVARAQQEFSLAVVADAYEDLLHATMATSPFDTVTVGTRWTDG